MHFNNKITEGKYQLIPRALAFIYKEDEILFIHKKKKNSFGYGKINGVGGHIEQGEDPFEAIKREVLEETRLIIDDFQLVAILTIDIGTNPGVLLFVFKAEYTAGTVAGSMEGDVIWMRRSEALANPSAVKDLGVLLEITENHKDGAAPVIGKYLYSKDGELRIVI